MPSKKELTNALRALSMDAVEKANSGHPGAPMGMADIAEVLWRDYLIHDPQTPDWINRDRFVLSNGHASILLYSLLHLSGYALSIEDMKHFRQLDSRTPGHPEYGSAPGIETTTGPLGQGLAQAVGMALAEVVLGAQFNRPDFELINHYTYVFMGDGCMMEGISHEACSLAGTLALSKLIVFYDDNQISIDGNVKTWFTDDTATRFRAYNWNVIENVDGHNREEVATAIHQARQQSNKPSLICCKTTIGWGAPNKQGTAFCHGSPLGAEEIAAAKEVLGWEYPPFEIPQSVRDAWDARDKGAKDYQQWNSVLDVYHENYPQQAAEFTRRINGKLPSDWQTQVQAYVKDVANNQKDMATRKSSGQALTAYSKILPELIGGSADLAGSNVTLSDISQPITERKDGNYIFFGVREFAMTSVATGLSLHGGFIPYTATFLTFSDYARNAIRLAAMMKQGVIMIYTHDSIGLGEDGPTHQPIEHLSSLRLIPGVDVWRPCDALESAVAWKIAIENRNRPTVLALSRQTLTAVERNAEQLAHIAQGAYILDDCDDTPALIMIATGSEVALILAAKKSLQQDGCMVRVISMPCAEVFERQSHDYQQSILPTDVKKRLVVEAGTSAWWHQYAGSDGRIIGIDTYGKSAPGNAVMQDFGFTVDNVLSVAKELLTK